MYCKNSTTVRLTSIYYRVSGNQNFCFTPTETIDGWVKKNKKSHLWHGLMIGIGGSLLRSHSCVK
jgi:hypothetical protein